MNKTELLLLCLVTIPLVIWDGVWKLIALRKSGRHDQLACFICLDFFNNVGIQPMIYILCFQKSSAPTFPSKPSSV